MPQSPATRPEDLGVTPWYLEDRAPGADTSSPGPRDRGSYPSCSYAERESVLRAELSSTRDSSVESEVPRPGPGLPRKAYMDLRDAIALLDETCPNQEPSPLLTPRTPRTPLTPHPRNKRARSKSSDNSSTYGNDRLSDRSLERDKERDKEKRRPFLRKIGISMTEDRPLLAKLAPRIIGKPYLEKIGPSKAVERPYLDKIGSSKTLDKFFSGSPRGVSPRRVEIGSARSQDVESERKEIPEPLKEKDEGKEETVPSRGSGFERTRSGKGLLLKMYSFETEDLEVARGQSSPVKDPRDPLRGASLDDVLEAGPSSLPPIEDFREREPVQFQQMSTSMAELVKCRVTTSEEIIFSNSCLGSPREAPSWGNSPRKETETAASAKGSMDRDGEFDSSGGFKIQETKNSPTKRKTGREVGTVPRREERSSSRETEMASPTKTRRQTSEDILDKMETRRNAEDKTDASKEGQFERRGISSDNLKLSREAFVSSTPSETSSGYQSEGAFRRDAFFESKDDGASRKSKRDIGRETFRQLHEKFELKNVPAESYAAYKRRARANFHARMQKQATIGKGTSNVSVPCDPEEPKTSKIADEDANREKNPESSQSPEVDAAPEDQTSPEVQTPKESKPLTVRSVLRKQGSVDNQNDQEADARSLRRPVRRIHREPSQETMDLLTELRMVKSLLRTPSFDKDDEDRAMPMKLPKKILLTDKEFCLSVERENSFRGSIRSSRGERRNEDQEPLRQVQERRPSPSKISGPALFEKRCLSLDYADEERPQKPEARAISLASARSHRSETEDTEAGSSDLALICDSKSYCSDVFNTPSEETDPLKREDLDPKKDPDDPEDKCQDILDLDVPVPVDQKTASKGRVHAQNRAQDLYEIISPRSTPFRMKKRLGRISVEEATKQESFTLNKVDCRSVVIQKRTKCLPL